MTLKQRIFSEKRKRLVKKLIESFPDRKIEVYGLYAPWYKGFFKWLFRPYRSVIKNRDVSPSQVNSLYNRSRVVVNIHGESQSDGANPRVFEICGSGAYQVCDSNAYIRSLFPEGEVGLYTDEVTLIEAVRYALENNPDPSRAYGRVSMEHTYANRIRTVQDQLGI